MTNEFNTNPSNQNSFSMEENPYIQDPYVPVQVPSLDKYVIIDALDQLNCTNWRKIDGLSYEGIEWIGEPTATKEEVELKIKEIIQNAPMNILRQERDRRIAETDWWVLPDRNPTSEQLAYRQALRDLPSNVNPVFNENKTEIVGFDWPEKP